MPSEPIIAAPSRASVHRALASLDRTDHLPAALHLALPYASSVKEVQIDSATVTWRDVQVPLTRDAAATATALSHAGWALGDRAVDLDRPSWAWLKRRARGSRVDLAGTDLLFRGPRVWVDASLPICIDEQVVLAIRHHLTPPLAMSCQDTAAVIEARSPSRWQVDPLARSRVPVTDRADAAAVIARRCQARTWTVQADHVILDVPGGRVHVPWGDPQAVHPATAAQPWWDTGTGPWTALGVDDQGRVWLRHDCGIRGWWDGTP